MSERILEGTILAGEELEPVTGRLVIEAGTITAIEEAAVASDDIICPTFINAHTHIGDSIAKEAGTELSLPALVAPPDGLKHQLLRRADAATLIDAMERSLRYMAGGGIGACYDFREGGVDGVQQIRQASSRVDIDALAFGRGDAEVLAVADGYGASGAADEDFESVRNAASRRGKPFAIHAGEVDSGDINAALDLDPDFLVHMVHAEAVHLDRLGDAGIPVVCCPRSNLVTDVGRPPIPSLHSRTTVALGTDNVMLNSPSMFREMAFTATMFDLDATTVLKMATVNAAAILGRPDGVIDVGRPARVIILDGASDNLHGSIDPVRSVVCRADRQDVSDVLLPPIESGHHQE